MEREVTRTASRHSENWLAIDAKENTFDERTKITEIAATTLCKLKNLMKQMKDWREDRANLKRNIWRLKLALRTVGKETSESLQGDPLIEHQREELKRLKATNDALRAEMSDIKAALIDAERNVARNANDRTINNNFPIDVRREFYAEIERLNNEILRLRNKLREAETERGETALERLRRKLKEFMIGDQTVEIIFTDMIGKVAETVANLSEELVNACEHLHKSRTEGDNLQVEIDQLKAMLRTRNGNAVDYRERTNELVSIAERLKREITEFKVNAENKSFQETLNIFMNAERLTNDLRSKVKHDREALLAAGEPNSLRYMKKLISLRIDLRTFHVGLEKFSAKDLSHSREKDAECKEYLKNLTKLKDCLKLIDIEIGKLKNERITRYCQDNGIEASKYLKKLEELELIVKRTKVTITWMRKEKNSCEKTDIERLESLIQRLNYETKRLEVIVMSNDFSSLFKRIEQLEESLIQQNVELTEKNELANTLEVKYSKVKADLDQKSKEAKDALNKIAVLKDDNHNLREKIKNMEEKLRDVMRERDASRKKLEEIQQTKREINILRVKIESLQCENESLLEKAETTNNLLAQRKKQIEDIISEKSTLEATLNEEISKLKIKLQATIEENQNQLNKIDEPNVTRENQSSDQNTKDTEPSLETMTINLQILQTELKMSKKDLNNAKQEIVDLKNKLEDTSRERMKLEMEMMDLALMKESLTYQLNIERATLEKRKEESTKLWSEINKREIENSSLKDKSERLRVELTELRREKELLKKSVVDINDKYLTLENQAGKYESERNVLRAEVNNFKVSSEHLALELERVRGELNEATDKIKGLKLENSRFNDNLDALTLKNTAIEARVQVLLTEKNDLATRINELDQENVALKDQLNKVKAENEYFTIELNKSRIENDKATTKNTLLQHTCDEMKTSRVLLERTNNELLVKFHEIQSEYRILDNQLKILRTTNFTHKNDEVSLIPGNDKHNDQLDDVNLQRKMLKMEGEKSSIINNAIAINQQAERDIECTDRKDLFGSIETKRNNTKRKMKSNKFARYDENVKKKDDSTKDELTRLRVENEALKFEMMNLRIENSQVRLELSRTKDEFENLRIKLTEAEVHDSTIAPISNKLKIVKLYYRQEINEYPSCYNPSENVGVLRKRQDSWSDNNASPRNELASNRESDIRIERLIQIIDKLKIENVALKIEVNELRRNVIGNLTREERMRNELGHAVDEIQALKLELTKLRDEKESLRVRMDTATTELDKLKTERAALKDELLILRKRNYDLRYKSDELQNDYYTLKKMNIEYREYLSDAVKEINKYTVSAGCPNRFEDQLRELTKKYTSDGHHSNVETERVTNVTEETSSETLNIQSNESNGMQIKEIRDNELS